MLLASMQARQIHQVVVTASPGDAITNAAFETRTLLRRDGAASDIYARFIDPTLAGEVLPLGSFPSGRPDGVILYHASIGQSEVTRFLMERPERLVMLYHNMSPAAPFAPYDPGFAALLEQGRRELEQLRDRVTLPLAVSCFNASDLESHGYRDVKVAPLIVDPRRLLSVTPHAETVRWQAEVPGPVLLFVGQLLPHKQPHVLLQAFHALCTYLLPDAHLFLVGAPRLPRYKEVLQFFIEELNLTHAGIIKSPVSEAELVAYYRRADAFVTLSEHEGFCVPLLEAMAFEKPILARACGAIPGTLEDAGLMIGPDDGALVAAEAMCEILSNDPLRTALVERGRVRLRHFHPDNARAILLDHLSTLA